MTSLDDKRGSEIDDLTLDEWLAQAIKRGKTEVLYADGTTHSQRIERLISALRESREEISYLREALKRLKDTDTFSTFSKYIDEALAYRAKLDEVVPGGKTE